MKRISFRIEQKLSKIFDDKASKIGIPKSSLLREWILGNPAIHLGRNPNFLKTQNSKQSSSYSLYLDKDLTDLIELNSSQLNISKSDYIRKVIETNLNSEIRWNLKNILEINTTFRNLHFESAIKFIESKDGNPYLKNILETYINTEKGMINTANELLKNLNTIKTSLPLGYEALAYSILAHTEIVKGNYEYANFILNNTLPKAYSIKSRSLLGRLNYQLGLLNLEQNKIQEAEDYFEQSMDYLDILNNPLQVAKVCLRQAKVMIFKMENKTGRKFLNKSHNLITTKENKDIDKWFNAQQSSFDLMEGNFQVAEREIKKSLEFFKTLNSTRDMYHYLTSLVILKLATGNINDLRYLKTEIDDCEKQLGIPQSESISVILNNIDSIDKLDSENNKFNLHNYLLNSAKYIYSKKDSERKKGEVRLINMMEKSPIKLAKAAIQSTIKTKKIHPLR